MNTIVSVIGSVTPAAETHTTTLQFLIGTVMPYFTLVVLVLGLGYRIQKWRKAAVGNMALYPAAGDKSSLWKKVLGEVVFFSSFRKENKSLWVPTWVFHITLLLILAGHSRLLFALPDKIMMAFGMTDGSIGALSAWAGGLFGVVIMVAAFALLNRRFVKDEVREVSSGEDYWIWILLVCIILTGNALRFFTHYDVNVTRGYFASLFTAVPNDPLFLLHFFLVQLLLIYLPFGKFLHIPGIFYSKTLVAKDY